MERLQISFVCSVCDTIFCLPKIFVLIRKHFGNPKIFWIDLFVCGFDLKIWISFLSNHKLIFKGAFSNGKKQVKLKGRSLQIIKGLLIYN